MEMQVINGWNWLEYPEFHAIFQMLKIRKYKLYSDKLRLSVVDLKHIDLAAAKDKPNGMRGCTVENSHRWETKMITQQAQAIEVLKMEIGQFQRVIKSMEN